MQRRAPHRRQRRVLLRLMALAHQVELMLDRAEVGRRLGVDHHQVDRQAALRPQPQRALERLHQRQPGQVRHRRQQDRAVARDRVAPQQAPVAAQRRRARSAARRLARQRRGQRGGQAQQRGPALGVELHLAQPDRRHRVRHRRDPVDDRGLAVLVDQRIELLARGRRRGGEGQPHPRARRQRQPHADRRHRVQPGVERTARPGRLGALGGARPVRLVPAPEPARAVGGELRRLVEPGRRTGEEVNRVHLRLALQPRLAAQVDRRVAAVDRRLDEEIGEGRMRLVGARLRQRRLQARDQAQRQRSIAQVLQLDLAQLEIVLRADAHLDAAEQVRALRLEHHPVAVERGAVARRRIGRGHRRQRGRRRGRAVLAHQPQHRAGRAAQRVVAPAADADALPAAPATAMRAQAHAVAAVAQQLRRHRAVLRHVHRQRGALDAQPARRRQRQRLAQRRRLARGRLVQQRPHRAHQRVAAQPAPRCLVEQHHRQRHQRHALMVRHDGVDPHRLAGPLLARDGEVQRLDEAQRAAGLQVAQALQVGHRLGQVDHQRHHGRVGRDHALVGRGAPQRQPRRALRAVLVGQRVVARRMRGLRHAPGQAVARALRPLLPHRRAGGLVEHAALRLVEHQRGHQVLEHRARPGAQAHLVADRREGPAQRRPVPHRHVALGDGQQAGQAAFRGQQVIVAAVELAAVGAQADVQQPAHRIEEHRVVGRQRQRAAARRQLAQPALQRGRRAQVLQQRLQRVEVVAQQPQAALVAARGIDLGHALPQRVELGAGLGQPLRQ